MKVILVILIFVIGSCSYYGAVDSNGNKTTDINEFTPIETTAVENEEISKFTENIEKEDVVKMVEDTVTQQNTSSIAKEIKQEKQYDNKVATNLVTSNEATNTQVKNVTDNKPLMENKVISEKQETKVETVVNNCDTGNHKISVGNTNKWFNTKTDAINVFENEKIKWENKWTNFEIDDDEYYKNRPKSYEIYSCSQCGKWTISIFYN